MRYKKWQILVFLCCVTMLFSSCVRNYFDQQKYEEIVQDESPVPNVDSNHDWMMATGKGLVVDLSGVANVKLVRIFTDNPALTEFAEVVGEAYPSGDSRFVMNIAYPSRFETLYAAAVDSEDYYTIVSFRPGSSTNVDFTNPIVKHEKMPYHYQYQTYVYLFEEEYPQPGDYDFNDVASVVSDNVQGVRDIINYLVSMGHKKIAFITGDDTSVTQKRIASFYKTCGENNLVIKDEYIKKGRYHLPKVSGEATRELLALDDKPTVIMYPDDYSLLGGITEIEKHGYKIPDDISIVGYDGIKLSRLLRPIITTYVQNSKEIGIQATKKLIDLIESPRTTIPDRTLVIGGLQEGQTVKNLTNNGDGHLK